MKTKNKDYRTLSARSSIFSKQAAAAPQTTAGAWLLLALAWWFLFTPWIWMWWPDSSRPLLDSLVSAALFAPLFLWRPLARISAVVLVLAGLSYLAYFFAVHSRIDEYFWITLFASHPQEAWEYVRSYRWQDAARLLCWAALAIVAARQVWRHAPVVQSRGARGAMAVLCLVWAAWAGASWVKGDAWVDALRKIDRVYPTGLVEGYLKYTRTTQALYTVPPVAAPQNAAMADLIIAVIGESASAERWSLLGYAGNDTNASLRPHSTELLVLPVISNGMNTAKAVPVLLSGYDAAHLPAQGVPTYMDLARRAGFVVSSISNQGAAGSNESFFQVAFRQRSDRFMSLPDGQFDSALTAPLERQVDAFGPQQKQLITLHGYGSHPSSEKRYPPDVARWADVYDNSIAYSSDLLAQWITRLDQIQDRRVALLYISDHGLNTPACGGQYTHGNARSAYTVPMLVWGNAAFRDANPGWWQQAKDHTGSAYDNRIYHATMAELLGFASDYPSLAAAAPPPEPRIDGKPLSSLFKNDNCHAF